MIRAVNRFAFVLAAVLSPAAFGAEPKPADPPANAPNAPQPATENPAMVQLTMSTSKGEIKLELDPEKAPISTANFLSYVDKQFYEGTIFHRVIAGFMIQGGGFTADMQQKPTDAPIKNEWQNGLKNMRGTIAMARTNAPDSATSQFYINVVDNGMLDMPRGGAAYAVFGKVVGGMDVVDAIKAVPTGSKNGMGDVPTETVTINSVVQTGGPKLADLKAKVDAALAKAEQAAAEAMKAVAEANKKQFEEGIALVKAKGGDVEKGVTTPSGLWYTDIKVGEGASPQVADKVKVHYTGWLTNGNKFDSSLDRGQPIEWPLNQFVKGWTEGIGSMKPGGKRFLVIPPQLGYGANGMGGVIPPNATLVFEVEYFDVVK